MMLTKDEVRVLWDRYHLPDQKRIHVALVSRVAVYIGNRLNERHIPVNVPLLQAAGLLHDIDKNVQKRFGETHPESAVRVLCDEGLGEIAQLVSTHALHQILDEKKAPRSTEQRVLYLADKMVKYEIVGVDGRFALWRTEELSPSAVDILDACYPLVKKLESEIFLQADVRTELVVKFA